MATHWPGPDPDAAAGASVGGCVWGRDPLVASAGAGAEAIAVEGADETEKNRLTVGCRVGNGDGTPGAVPQKQPLPQVWKKPHCWGSAGSAGQLVRHGMNRGPLGAGVVRTRGRCCVGALLPVVLELAVGADDTRDADGRGVGLGREVGGWVGAVFFTRRRRVGLAVSALFLPRPLGLDVALRLLLGPEVRMRRLAVGAGDWRGSLKGLEDGGIFAEWRATGPREGAGNALLVGRGEARTREGRRIIVLFGLVVRMGTSADNVGECVRPGRDIG